MPPERTARDHIGPVAALGWILLCLRWFDDGQRLCPRWFLAVPPWILALPTLVLLVLWLHRRRHLLWGVAPERALVLVVALAILFRLPLALQGARGYTTADACLSGINALHIRDGRAHPVFIPHIPYSGTLKSHVAAALSPVLGLPRAFTASSVLFYALFVGVLFALARRSDPDPFVATAAGLYAAFSPPFVTHYSLSNDGNYVEVLALGTWGLLLAARFVEEPDERPALALLAGLLLGLALWCHLLAVFHLAAVGLVLVVAGGAIVPILRFVFGILLGFLPGLLWNSANSWDSLWYLVPGLHPMKSLVAGPGLLGRGVLMATEQLPTLFGFDPGYPPWAEGILFAAGVVALLAGAWGLLGAVREGRSRPALLVLALFAVVNLAAAILALPYVPQNPRYVLFLLAPWSVFLARVGRSGWRRAGLAALVATGALGSLAQAPEKIREDAKWEQFVSDLEAHEVRYCYSDFYVAIRIDFLSEERIVCSSKLGPTTTEYFFEYRQAVEKAPAAALVAASTPQAEKLGTRLERLGVEYTRLDLLKATFLPSRKVDPEELFPGKTFPYR